MELYLFSMGFFERLQKRWKLRSWWQVLVILIVFALTGFTILFIRKPLLALFGINRESLSTLGMIIYLLLILPVYQIILLLYGFLFGQFNFFWEFEKKMFRRIFGLKGNSEEERERRDER